MLLPSCPLFLLVPTFPLSARASLLNNQPSLRWHFSGFRPYLPRQLYGVNYLSSLSSLFICLFLHNVPAVTSHLPQKNNESVLTLYQAFIHHLLSSLNSDSFVSAEELQPRKSLTFTSLPFQQINQSVHPTSLWRRRSRCNLFSPFASLSVCSTPVAGARKDKRCVRNRGFCTDLNIRLEGTQCLIMLAPKTLHSYLNMEEQRVRLICSLSPLGNV